RVRAGDAARGDDAPARVEDRRADAISVVFVFLTVERIALRADLRQLRFQFFERGDGEFGEGGHARALDNLSNRSLRKFGENSLAERSAVQRDAIADGAAGQQAL